MSVEIAKQSAEPNHPANHQARQKTSARSQCKTLASQAAKRIDRGRRFSEFLCGREFLRLFPPHPGPLPQGEGACVQIPQKVRICGIGDEQAATLPLPEGEGRGEGERRDHLGWRLMRSLTKHLADLSLLFLPI